MVQEVAKVAKQSGGKVLMVGDVDYVKCARGWTHVEIQVPRMHAELLYNNS